MKLMSNRTGKAIVAAVALLWTLVLTGCGGGDNPQALIASGKEYVAKGDFKAAALQFKNALQKTPDSAEGRYLLGKALLEAGDPAGAEVELRRARDLRYSADDVMPLLLRSYLMLGQYAKVIEEAQKAAVISAAGKAAVQATLGSAHFVLGNRAAAQQSIDAALAAQPDNALAQLAQARLKVAAGDLNGAVEVVEKVIAKAPADFEALKFMGDLLFAQNKPDAAIASFRKVIALRPDFVGAHASLVYALLASSKFDAGSKQFEEAVKQFSAMKALAANNPQTLSLEGQIAFARKDFPAAREAAQKLLRIAPNASAALQFAGAVEFNMRSFAQAEAYLTKALQAAPDVLGNRRWLAMNYLAAGQISKAVSVLEPILAKIESDADFLGLAGEAYMQSGDIRKAEEFLVKAAKLQPDDPGRRTALALARLGRGDGEAALAELEQISGADKGTRADLALIAAHWMRGEFDKTLRAIDSLDKKQPNNPLTFNLRGRTQLAKKDLAGARRSFERALELNAGYYQAAASLANLDLGDAKPEAAFARFEKVVAADPKSVQGWMAMAEFKFQSKAPGDEVIALLNKAIAADAVEPAPRVALVNYYIIVKDTKKAIAAGQDALAAIPDRPELFDALGQAQRASGEINQALATYNKMAAALPNSAEPHMYLAQLHADNKDLEAAARSLRKALAIKPDLVNAQRGLIQLDLGDGKDRDALAVAREVQKQRPKEGVGYLLEGDINASRKSWGAAADAYRAGLKQSTSAELAMKLHQALAVGGKKSEAAAFAAVWFKEQPRDRAFRQYMGEYALVTGDFANASIQFRSLLESDPDNPTLLNNLATVAGALKQPDAIALAEKANRLAPNRPELMDTLGVLLVDKGDFARALELLGKAAKSAPGMSGIRFNYARALAKAGKKAEAKLELGELAKLGEKFPDQAEVARLLREL